MTNSDEIREFVCRSYKDEHMDPRELLAIANRMDREMVELPLSADRKIWTGREECFWIEARGGAWSRHSLHSLDLVDGSRWYVRDAGGLGYEAGAAWHERPDSFKSIADELEEWSEDNAVDGNHEVFYRAGDFADRIRRLAAKED